MKVRIITDARFVRDRSGAVGAPNATVAGDRWRRGLGTGVPIEALHVRVDPDPTDGVLPISARIVPLPFYKGVRSFILTLPWLLWSLDRAIRDADVIVSRVPGLIGSLTALLSFVRRRPLAIEVVGDVVDALPRGQSRGLLARIALGVVRQLAVWNMRWSVRRASAVRFVTQRSLQSKFPASQGAATAAFSSVDLGRWLNVSQGPQAEFPEILAVGSQEQLYKGHDDLIEAMPAVLRVVPRARLVLVGAGKTQQQLRDLAEAKQVSDCVRFEGYVKDPDTLIQLVDRCWVFAMPSRGEGLPRALVEAMARSRPCVGTPVGGIPELLTNGQLVPVADPKRLAERLTAMLLDPEERHRLGRINRDRAQFFSPEVLRAASSKWTADVAALLRSRSDRP